MTTERLTKSEIPQWVDDFYAEAQSTDFGRNKNDTTYLKSMLEGIERDAWRRLRGRLGEKLSQYIGLAIDELVSRSLKDPYFSIEQVGLMAGGGGREFLPEESTGARKESRLLEIIGDNIELVAAFKVRWMVGVVRGYVERGDQGQAISGAFYLGQTMAHMQAELYDPRAIENLRTKHRRKVGGERTTKSDLRRFVSEFMRHTGHTKPKPVIEALGDSNLVEKIAGKLDIDFSFDELPETYSPEKEIEYFVGGKPDSVKIKSLQNLIREIVKKSESEIPIK